MRTTTTRQSGFTLVEIAIVLVIIGLLLGGILKGQEMITQARIKNVINDFNGITAAYFSYQDRYRAVPGDDAGAQGRWSLNATYASGNGTQANGKVDGAWNAATAAPEPDSRLFWWHLRQSGFIAGASGPATDANQAAQYTAQPVNAFGGQVGAQNGVGDDTFGLSGLIICSASIQDKVAIAVDASLDDSSSNSGSVRGTKNNPTANSATLGAADGSYAETGQYQYLLCKGI